MKCGFFVSVIILALLGSAPNFAEELIVNAENRGRLDGIHMKDRLLVIDDTVFIMPLNFKVYNTKGKTLNRYALKTGQRLKYFVRLNEPKNTLYVDWVRILK